MHQIHFGDNLEILKAMPAGSADLIYIDPPFNSGAARSHRRMKAVRTDADR